MKRPVKLAKSYLEHLQAFGCTVVWLDGLRREIDDLLNLPNWMYPLSSQHVEFEFE